MNENDSISITTRLMDICEKQTWIDHILLDY